MPKIVEYPRASLKNSLELADAVDSLGGSSTTAMAADRMDRKVSGAFNALVSAASKFGLVDAKSGNLSVEPLYRSYKLAYNDAEKSDALKRALVSPPLFSKIYERFAGKVLPVEHFEKLLIREFDVPDEQASRIASYFIDGANMAGIINDSNELMDSNSGQDDQHADPKDEGHEDREVEDDPEDAANVHMQNQPEKFSIAFKGPGINSTFVVAEAEDLLIVEAILAKIKKKISHPEST